MPTSAKAGDALERYNARLLEIARSYNQQISEIRKNRRRDDSGKIASSAAEEQTRQLATKRNQALAEARRIYQKERMEGQVARSVDIDKGPVETTDQWAAQQQAAADEQREFWARVAREEVAGTELWAAQWHAAEDRQKAFWTKVTREEVEGTEHWAAQLQAAENQQQVFWGQLLQAPKPQRERGQARDPGIVSKRPGQEGQISTDSPEERTAAPLRKADERH